MLLKHVLPGIDSLWLNSNIKNISHIFVQQVFERDINLAQISIVRLLGHWSTYEVWKKQHLYLDARVYQRLKHDERPYQDEGARNIQLFHNTSQFARECFANPQPCEYESHSPNSPTFLSGTLHISLLPRHGVQ
jgi:hypothetical protein